MNNRLKVFQIIIIIFFLLLVLRAGYLQLVRGSYYYQLSEGNRISLRPVNAPRGKIFDCQGNILVSSKLSYNLYLLPNETPPDLSVNDLLKHLSELTTLTEKKLLESYRENRKDKSQNLAIVLKRNIKPETMVIIEENSEELAGLLVKESSIRDYVYNELAAHILGYVGEINAKELKKMSSMGRDYNGGDIIGKNGLEKEYETFLKGTDGIKQIEVNSIGKKVRILGTKPPRPGNNLVLNIDLDLQKNVETILEKQLKILREEAEEDSELEQPTGAAAIVMDTSTGAILSMASIPDYDLNKFAEGFSGHSYQQLTNDPLNPLLNRPLMAVVPPGSIFKLVTGTAAIEELGINTETEFIDKNGKFYIPNWSEPYKNWHQGGEGELNFTRAIARSNNIVFYKLGYRLYQKFKGQKLTQYARKYGLGSKTGIDIPGERSGLVPDREWKKKKNGEGWYPGDSVNLSIGQGGLLTTPIQLIEMVNTIATGGIMYRPYLVDKITNSEGEVIVDYKPEIRKYLDFNNDVFFILKQGMTEVTNSSYGTARSVFKEFPIKVAGKTGTAQTGSKGSNHGWFAGFAPIVNPEITVLVFLENGNSSSNNLPIAAEIIKHYFGFNKKTEIRKNPTLYIKENYFKTTDQLLEFFKEVFSKKE